MWMKKILLLFCILCVAGIALSRSADYDDDDPNGYEYERQTPHRKKTKSSRTTTTTTTTRRPLIQQYWQSFVSIIPTLRPISWNVTNPLGNIFIGNTAQSILESPITNYEREREQVTSKPKKTKSTRKKNTSQKHLQNNYDDTENSNLQQMKLIPVGRDHRNIMHFYEPKTGYYYALQMIPGPSDSQQSAIQYNRIHLNDLFDKYGNDDADDDNEYGYSDTYTHPYASLQQQPQNSLYEKPQESSLYTQPQSTSHRQTQSTSHKRPQKTSNKKPQNTSNKRPQYTFHKQPQNSWQNRKPQNSLNKKHRYSFNKKTQNFSLRKPIDSLQMKPADDSLQTKPNEHKDTNKVKPEAVNNINDNTSTPSNNKEPSKLQSPVNDYEDDVVVAANWGDTDEEIFADRKLPHRESEILSEADSNEESRDNDSDTKETEMESVRNVIGSLLRDEASAKSAAEYEKSKKYFLFPARFLSYK